MGPDVLVPIAFFFAATTVIRLVLRHKERRLELESQAWGGGRDSAARLERMEQAIDAIALEIERISEAQRFTTRLLSERPAESGMLPRTTPDRTSP